MSYLIVMESYFRVMESYGGQSLYRFMSGRFPVEGLFGRFTWKKRFIPLELYHFHSTHKTRIRGGVNPCIIEIPIEK
jgi:hypothetical protein